MFSVSLRHQKGYALEEVKGKIADIFGESWAGYRDLKPGDTILLKSNCLSAKPVETAVTTHPVVLEATIQILLDKGCRITIGDSPALQRLSTVVKKTGISPILERYDVRLQELDGPKEVEGPKGGTFRSFEVSRHCFEFDHFINIAKFKTHSMMILTLCVKNLFGCIPGKKKAAWHLAIGEDRHAFARMLVELGAILPVDFHLLDGIVAMEGNGPGNGTPVPLGVLLGSENAAAVDSVAARLIGLDPGGLLTCQAAADLGTGPSPSVEISVLGDSPPPSPFPFKLPEPARMDWGLPGLLKGILRRFLLPFPAVDRHRCVTCAHCQKVCPAGAISLKNGKIMIKTSLCIRCYCCQEICPENAIVFKKH